MKVLITGAAGFIGFHTVKKYVQTRCEVIGLDNINDYYDIGLKYDRLAECGISKAKIVYGEVIKSSLWNNYSFIKMDIHNDSGMNNLFQSEKFDLVINLAGQAGVRYSLENPKSYIESNIVGFLNILEGCRHTHVRKLVYASSSSVYGMSDKSMLSESDSTDKPVSLYAATKKSNELMAYTYSHLYDLRTIGLRFFTVYGPWGRPDMAPFLFTKAIIKNTPIRIFNHGNMKRDFTYIDDIVEGVFQIAKKNGRDHFNILNIGNNSPVQLLDFIGCIEDELQISSIKLMQDMQPGDVINTWADTKELVEAIGYKPGINIRDGVKKFISWYKNYYNIE